MKIILISFIILLFTLSWNSAYTQELNPGDGVRITFSGIAANIIGEFPTHREDLLAKALSANISLDVSAGECHVTLPQRIDESLIQKLSFF